MNRRYTRRELAEKLREHGFPISKAKLDKMCAPSENKGPPVDTWWGTRPLYDLDQALVWAQSCCKSHKSALSPAASPEAA
jgi:hypothetical protein